MGIAWGVKAEASAGAIAALDRRGVPGADTARVQVARELAPHHGILFDAPPDVLAQRIGEVEVAFTGVPAALVPRAVNLRWVQIGGAGAERSLLHYPDGQILITNASGVHAVPITEHVLALLFAFTRGVHVSVRAQGRRVWLRHDLAGPGELRGARLLVLGLGAIGGELARTASALGMCVVGVRRRPEQGGVDGLVRVVGPEELHAELPEADFVVITLPYTTRTAGMFGAREIGLMKRTAYLVNIGRGGTVRQEDLVRALKDGRIAGAGLDVFEEEPLPEDSPLWDLENVIVTAHYAGFTPHYGERLWDIFLDNLGRYVGGEPLRNVVNRSEGY